MKRTLIENFLAMRKVSVPLGAFSTSDQQALVERIKQAGNGTTPIVQWDRLRGFRPVNDAGGIALAKMGKTPEEVGDRTAKPENAMLNAERLPEDTVLILHNWHLFIKEPVIIQGVANLRDEFKSTGRTLVMLAPSWHLPIELQQDVVVLEDPLPDDEQLGGIVTRLYSEITVKEKPAPLPAPKPDVMERLVGAGRALSAFAWENRAAMSLDPTKGIDLDLAWEHKRLAINQTRGLRMASREPGALRLADLHGVDAAVDFVNRRFKGNEPPRILLFQDEIEKSYAGVAGDNTGITQDLLGQQLQEMEDSGWDGMIMVGPPGVAKTAFCNAVAASHDVPFLRFDLGGMKASLVGESEQAMRAALGVVRAIAGSRVFVVATCNKMEVLPSELRRRFKTGIWYFDLPTDQARAAMWKLYVKRYGLDPAQTAEIPDDSVWTGAEIRNCCEHAYKLKATLVEAADFVIPVAVADPERIEALRTAADHKFKSASAPGHYRMLTSTTPAAKTGRAVKF